MQLALSMETAAKNQKEINTPAVAGREHNSSSTGVGVHKVALGKTPKPPDRQTRSCYRCGKTGHHAGYAGIKILLAIGHLGGMSKLFLEKLTSL